MSLTVKQEKYVQALFRGLSQRQAYKEAFDSSKMKDETIDKKACALSKDEKVRGRLNELKHMQAEKTGWTVERLINEFIELKEICKKEVDLSTAARSLENIGKLLGMYTEKIQHSGNLEVTIVDDIK